MKNIYSLLSLIFILNSSFAQNKQLEKADKLYNGYQYVDAVKEYLKLADNQNADAYIYKQLANSYYKISNIDEASKWYERSLEKNQDAETYYRYAQVLKSQGKYDAAKKQMDIFSEMEPNDLRAQVHLKNPDYITNLGDISKSYTVEEVSINDDQHSDFSPILDNDNTLYFVSTRKSSRKADVWTNKPYLDIYKSVENADGSLSEPQEVEELNTVYHDGPISISDDGKTMYFSRDGHSEGLYKKLKSDGVKLAQQGIYKATLLDGKWSDIRALPINSSDYTVTHPSISKDNKTLYFASNMPGGYGDNDIWKISVNGDNYGKPINLGTNVNTSGKEGFPYINEDNILYFASSGRQGYGGFDVFKCDLNQDEKAVNLGNAINTKRDDFAFSVGDSNKIGYFSSNRSGVDNIYKATVVCNFNVNVIVKDYTTNTPLEGANVLVKDAKNNEIAKLVSSTENTNFNLNCEDGYTIHVSKEGFNGTARDVSLSEGEDITITAILKPINEIITETEVKLNTIYFEFGKSNITQQGALELDKLVAILNEYPQMKILVKSHTDSQGSPQYNLKLSEKRAYATLQYVISKGIEKERLEAKGLGSTEPKIDCKSNCTDEDNSKNRRSEFLIIKE